VVASIGENVDAAAGKESTNSANVDSMLNETASNSSETLTQSPEADKKELDDS